MDEILSQVELGRRTGVQDADIKDWVKKTRALERTVKGIINGTIDPDKASLKEYGILTEEEKAAKLAKNEEKRLARERLRAEKKQIEREKWWEEAKMVIKKNSGQSGDKSNLNPEENKKDHYVSIAKRYCNDYSRWSDRKYIPDDQATKEEEKEAQSIIEEKQRVSFEKENKEFCQAVLADLEKRNKALENIKLKVNKINLKAKKHFLRKEFASAIECYKEALSLDPFDSVTLLNVGICYLKREIIDDALEYCTRSLAINSKNTKALYNRSTIFEKQNAVEKALEDMKVALKLDPENAVILERCKKLSCKVKDKAAEKEVESVLNKGDKKTIAPEDIRNEVLGILIIISTESKEKIYAIKDRIFFVVNQLMVRITQRNGNNQIFTQDDLSVSNLPSLSGITAFDVIVLFLSHFSLAKTYIRMSGHLETLLILLDQTLKDENIRSNSISKLFTLVAESIRKEDKSIEMIMTLDPERRSVLLGALNQWPKNKVVCKSTVDNFFSICNFIEALLGDAIADHYLQVKRFVYIPIKEILCCISSFLYHLSNNYHEYECLQHIDKFKHIKSILLSIFSNSSTSFWELFNFEKKDCNPSRALFSMLLVPLDTFGSAKVAQSFRRTSLEIIVALSNIEYFRKDFISAGDVTMTQNRKGVTGVHILLALIRSSKSEDNASRVMAFMALTNATVELPTQNSPTERDCVLSLLKRLGKSTLLELALACSSHTSCSLKLRAFNLICQNIIKNDIKI